MSTLQSYMDTTNRVDTEALLRKGQLFVMDNYALRDEMYKKVEDAFLDGIESLETRDCRERVEADGLAQMHQHFPVSKVLLLEDYLIKRLRSDLYYWSFRVGQEDLGLDHTFYVDHLIMMRIHYPFFIARQATNVQEPSFPLSEKLRLGMAALKNWRLMVNSVDKVISHKKTKSGKVIKHDPDTYHKNLPRPARSHGPHMDTWYGHSYDGINLWWSIDGVNEDNTIILYPEMFGFSPDYDPSSMYVADGFPLTKPLRPPLDPGQLLVFNPEMLHGTQVNIGNDTRVVISTRLNPETPRFNGDAAFHFENWHSSEDLRRKKVSTISVFPAKKYQGEPSHTVQSGSPVEKTVTIQCTKPLTHGESLQICASADLEVGKKLAVNLENAKVFLYRDNQGVRAFGRICPHLGIDLVDGYHDENLINCPGHGVAFSLVDGSSPRCEKFKLRQYSAFEQDGMIYLQHGNKDAGKDG